MVSLSPVSVACLIISVLVLSSLMASLGLMTKASRVFWRFGFGVSLVCNMGMDSGEISNCLWLFLCQGCLLQGTLSWSAAN